MKVAIFTHRMGHNYGGIIQNFALQTVVRNLGHEPETIDWHRLGRWESFRFAFGAIRRLPARWLKGDFKMLPLSPPWFHYKNIDRFISQRIALSKSSRRTTLARYIRQNGFEAIIVGSDQVWRPLYIEHIELMFLNFAEKLKVKRIAYAASFGVDNVNEFSQRHLAECSRLLAKFDAVSVREKSGVALCGDMLHRPDTVHLLDPTMLLDPDDYDSVIGRGRAAGRTLMCYILDLNPGDAERVGQIAKQLSLTAVIGRCDHQLTDDDTVEGWIAAIRDADCVVTDSFHGTVFSIIFNRPFLVTANAKRGNARLDSLLEMFGLEDRRINSLDELTREAMNRPIDWQRVNALRESKKQQSLSFLRNALS